MCSMKLMIVSCLAVVVVGKSWKGKLLKEIEDMGERLDILSETVTSMSETVTNLKDG